MKNITKIACYSLVAVALAAMPAISRADDATNSPPATAPAPVKKHANVLHGKVAAVDANAMTLTVGNSTITVTSKTKIFKDGEPAMFSDIAEGQMVSVSYKKDDDGKMTAGSVRIGMKKAPKPAETSTNAPPQ